MTGLPRVAVAYDYGAVGPPEIAEAADGLAELLFLVDTSTAHGAAVAPLLAGFAETADLAGIGAAGADRLVAGCAGVTTFSDTRLGLVAELARWAGLPQHSPEVAAALRDKWLQRRRLAAAGLPTPVGVLLPAGTDRPAALTAAAAVPLPAVLKPCAATASRDTYRIGAGADLRAALAAVGTPLPEAFLLEEMWVGAPRAGGLGDYVSVEAVSTDGAHLPFGVSDRLPLTPPFRETGLLVPDLLPAADRAAAVAVAVRALDALGVRWGVSHTELKLTADGPRLIEVNGRLGGHVDPLHRRAGTYAPIRAALLAALGRPAEPVRKPTGQAASLLVPMPAGGPPDRSLLTALARDLRRRPGVVGVTVARGQGGDRPRDGTMSAPVVVWFGGDRETVRAALHDVRSALGFLSAGRIYPG